MPNSTQQSVSTPPSRRLPLAELVALTAMLMALNALAIGIMLSALPQMGADFAVVQENDRQLIVVSYMLGPQTYVGAVGQLGSPQRQERPHSRRP